MPSFFDKLRNSTGIEVENTEENVKKESPKSKEEQSKKIPICSDNSKTKENAKEEDPDLKEETPEWFEPEGELAVDVYQTNEEIVIQSTIAGIKPDDLEISIENDVVTITGERKNTVEDQGKNYFYQECFWGAFSRQIILPEEVDGSRADASIKEGVLTLRIPKLERQKVRKVKVKEQ